MTPGAVLPSVCTAAVHHSGKEVVVSCGSAAADDTAKDSAVCSVGGSRFCWANPSDATAATNLECSNCASLAPPFVCTCTTRTFKPGNDLIDVPNFPDQTAPSSESSRHSFHRVQTASALIKHQCVICSSFAHTTWPLHTSVTLQCP